MFLKAYLKRYIDFLRRNLNWWWIFDVFIYRLSSLLVKRFCRGYSEALIHRCKNDENLHIFTSTYSKLLTHLWLISHLLRHYCLEFTFSQILNDCLTFPAENNDVSKRVNIVSKLMLAFYRCYVKFTLGQVCIKLNNYRRNWKRRFNGFPQPNLFYLKKANLSCTFAHSHCTL